MKYRHLSILVIFLLTTFACGEEFEDLEYNILTDESETLIELIDYEKEITPAPYTVNMYFTVSNRFNDLSDIQKENIEYLIVLRNGSFAGTAEPNATEISSLRNQITFQTKCFSFGYINFDGELSRLSEEYCYNI